MSLGVGYFPEETWSFTETDRTWILNAKYLHVIALERKKKERGYELFIVTKDGEKYKVDEELIFQFIDIEEFICEKGLLGFFLIEDGVVKKATYWIKDTIEERNERLRREILEEARKQEKIKRNTAHTILFLLVRDEGAVFDSEKLEVLERYTGDSEFEGMGSEIGLTVKEIADRVRRVLKARDTEELFITKEDLLNA